MQVLLAGHTGRLGGEVLAAAVEQAIAVVPLDRATLTSRGALERIIADGADSAILLDVTLPQGTEQLCKTLMALPTESLYRVSGVVIGTTGHSEVQLTQIQALSKRLPVCVVSNFSRGVFLFEEMLKAQTSSGLTVAELARALGFDLSLWEAHHTKKVDSPSGTAKTLATAAGVDFERIVATRVGKVVGEHTLFVAGESEELRVQHIAHTRRVFAAGALALCSKMFDAELPPGLYEKSKFFC